MRKEEHDDDDIVDTEEEGYEITRIVLDYFTTLFNNKTY